MTLVILEWCREVEMQTVFIHTHIFMMASDVPENVSEKKTRTSARMLC